MSLSAFFKANSGLKSYLQTYLRIFLRDRCKSISRRKRGRAEVPSIDMLVLSAYQSLCIQIFACVQHPELEISRNRFDGLPRSPDCSQQDAQQLIDCGKCGLAAWTKGKFYSTVSLKRSVKKQIAHASSILHIRSKRPYRHKGILFFGMPIYV